jgi:hypothetical protein
MLMSGFPHRARLADGKVPSREWNPKTDLGENYTLVGPEENCGQLVTNLPFFFFDDPAVMNLALRNILSIKTSNKL